jgi:hypothetical protein
MNRNHHECHTDNVDNADKRIAVHHFTAFLEFSLMK